MVSENYARNYALQTCYDDAAAATATTSKRKQSNENYPTTGCARLEDEDENEATESTDQFGVTIADTDDLPNELKRLLPGFYENLPDSAEVPSLPYWANIEKVKKGQQFGLKYLYGLNYSQTLSLIYLLASSEGLRPLIFTGKSHTPCLAHKRYLSTALRVKSWYETEFWDSSSTGYKNLKAVRSLHLHVSKRLSELSDEEIESRSNLENKLREYECERNSDDRSTALLCPLQRTLKADFGSNADDAWHVLMARVQAKKNDKRVYLNQLEMSVTQFGFFGLMLTYPEKFAAKNATDEELECFVHMWKLIGYLLGIKDEYNFCNGDLATVKLRSEHLIEYVVKPVVRSVTKEWEHMTRCAFQGIEKFTKLRINFESTMLYFCWILNIPTPNLLQYSGWKELTMFHMTRFIMTKGQCIPGFTKFFNYRITKIVERAQKEHYKNKDGR